MTEVSTQEKKPDEPALPEVPDRGFPDKQAPEDGGSVPEEAIYECKPEQKPTKELCNLVDDDCDGRIDEGTPNCVTTIAGSSDYGYQDGPALQAKLMGPLGFTNERNGVIYIADTFGHRIRKLDMNTGLVSTVAGDGKCECTQKDWWDCTNCQKDGPGLQAQLRKPYRIVSDGKGNIYFTEPYNHRIRRIDPSGNVSTLAGPAVADRKTIQPVFRDGPLKDARFAFPIGINFDNDGNLIITDRINRRIRKIDLAKGMVSTLAGGAINQQGISYKDGPAKDALFESPWDAVVDKDGNIYIADTFIHRIRKLTPDGQVSTFAGSGTTERFKGSHKDGPRLQAQLRAPDCLAYDPSKHILYIGESGGMISKLDLNTGMVTGLNQGHTTREEPRDGPIPTARFGSPDDLAIAMDGSLFFLHGVKLRKITFGSP